MSRIGKIARRTFLLGSVAIVGGVAFGYWKYKQPYGNPLDDRLADGEASLTPYVKVASDGITIITPRAEMGQGVHTTLAAMVAEELDVELDAVKIEHGPASYAYYNEAFLEEAVPFLPTDHSTTAEMMRGFTKVPAKFLALQLTGGSSTTPDGFVKMRKAGAAARVVLVKAAAQKLGVAESSLKTADGEVIAPNGEKVAYTELATLAATIEPPADPELRPQSEWKLLGKSQPRVDMVSKVTGTAPFGIDTELDGMLYATVRVNPFLGAGVKSYDATKTLGMRGVKKVVPVTNGLAVIATNTWYAMEGAKALKVEWKPAPYPLTTSEHFAQVAASFTEERQDSQNRNDGDVDIILAGGDVTELEYRAPYLSHATMEPMNATAWMRDGKLDIWAGNQNPTLARKFASNVTGIEAETIEIHTPYLGGGFGRRGEMDYITLATEVAQAMEGTPVKTTWSREEDMCHGFYRPISIGRIKAVMEDGAPKAMDIKLAAPGAVIDAFSRQGLPAAGPDGSIPMAAWEQPYTFPNYRVTAYKVPTMLPVTFWRSVGGSQNAFFQESALDELAHAAGVDPVEMRLKSLDHMPSRKVIEAVAEMSNWGSAVPEGHGRGMAFCLAFGVPTAEVIEVANTDDGIKVTKAFAAVDVGIALDPGNIEAQVMGGLNYGLSAAILSQITLDNGEVEQTNFHNYDAMRMYQAPTIEVRILENAEKIRGIGEPGTPPAAPALANAIFAATGTRLREMPFSNFVDFA